MRGNQPTQVGLYTKRQLVSANAELQRTAQIKLPSHNATGMNTTGRKPVVVHVHD